MKEAVDDVLTAEYVRGVLARVRSGIDRLHVDPPPHMSRQERTGYHLAVSLARRVCETVARDFEKDRK